jgi:hypothetical protein
VVVHQVDAPLANAAVMRSCWLDKIAAGLALFGPELLELARCLAAVAQKLLHVAGEAHEALILAFLSDVYVLAIGPIFLFLTHFFDHARVIGPTRPD